MKYEPLLQYEPDVWLAILCYAANYGDSLGERLDAFEVNDAFASLTRQQRLVWVALADISHLSGATPRTIARWLRGVGISVATSDVALALDQLCLVSSNAGTRMAKKRYAAGRAQPRFFCLEQLSNKYHFYSLAEADAFVAGPNGDESENIPF